MRMAARTIRVMRDRTVIEREIPGDWDQGRAQAKKVLGKSKSKVHPLEMFPNAMGTRTVTYQGFITSNKQLTLRNSFIAKDACAVPVLKTCWWGRGHSCVVPIPCVEVALEVARSIQHWVARWQPAWHVLVVFLRTPPCFQLICFDISSRQEVLCVGVRGSAMWHLNHAKQEHTFRFPRRFKEMWFPLCCKERVDLIATLCGDQLWCLWIRVPGSHSGKKREIKHTGLSSCNHQG